jgi:hypothetical protein
MRLLPVLFLVSCSTPPPAALPGPKTLSKSDVLEILSSLEAAFYTHWGTVEKTAEYRRLSAREVPLIREVADANGPPALMALRVLARLAPEEKFSPEAKGILYAAALGREQNFTRWGVISKSGFLQGVYGHELLAIGPPAAPYLQKLLTDRRRAPVTGAEAERTNREQADRVCDYAWVFLATIFDRPLAYAVDPRDRDPQIRELDLWLDRRR